MIVMLFLLDWRFALVSLLPVILGFAAMFKMAGPSMAEDMKLYQSALADMNNEAVEYVRGVPVVKTFGQTVHSFKQFKGTIDSYYDFVMSYCKKCRPSMLSYTVLVNSAFAFLIVLALILTGDGPVAQPVLLNFIFYVIFTPIIATAMTRVMFMSENGMIVSDAMSRIHSILDVEPLPEPHSGKVPTDNDIALENVTFRYTGGTTDAPHNVAIRVGAGEMVVLVGPSGGGNVKDISKETLMDTVAYVFQDSRLLKATILENVRLAKPNASRQEVDRVLHNAQCDDIIAKLPQGIDTVIGTRGVYLSGGEQQRIAIAALC